MPKGYMIFVEGGHTPVVVHEDYEAAVKVAYAHAFGSRGKEVLLLKIQKRLVMPEKAVREEEVGELPVHVPPKDEAVPKRRLGLKDLVFKERPKGGTANA
jgi:hypothetical protein